MADFPTVYADSISIESGRMLTDRTITASGVSSVSRRGLGRRDVIFNLTYSFLTSTSVQLIRSHFQDHFDFNQSFTVPRAVIGGFGVVSTGAEFYYDSALEETQKGIYTELSVTFRAIDDDNVRIELETGGSSDQSEFSDPKTTEDLSTYLFSGTAPFSIETQGATTPVSIAVTLEGGTSYL